MSLRTRTPSFDVVVVGAGPAGSLAALRLARAGHNVALLDRASEPRTRIVCSGIVGREAFQRLDLPREAVRDTLRRARFFGPSGARVDFEPRDPMAYVVDRTRFDAALAERAVAMGARLLRGFEARGIERSGRLVRLAVRNGRVASLATRAVVLATGYHRRLHAGVGLGTPGRYVRGAHADVPFGLPDGAELYFGRDVAPGFFAWAVPFGPGRARLGVLAHRDVRAFFARFLRSEAIRSRLGTDPEGIRPHTRGIVQGPVSPSYADRVLAVGEAAGQVKTTTAGGIYYGMLGAEIAAEVLDEGLRRDRLDAAFLARYETAWRARLDREIEAGFELQRAGQRMSDAEIDRLFTVLGSGLATAIRRVVNFDWHGPAVRTLTAGWDGWRTARRLWAGMAGVAGGGR
ncbi:MAG: NAD(P)/FAD-dependent oxidoreductase [Gemmatimonadota bacterium]